MGQEYEKNPYAYEDKSDEESSKESKKRKALLIALLLAVAGSALAAFRVNRIRRFFHWGESEAPLQHEWARARELAANPNPEQFGIGGNGKDTAGQRLLDSIHSIQEKIDKHNQTRSFLGQDIDVDKIIPKDELQEAARNAARRELQQIASFSPNRLVAKVPHPAVL